MLAQSLIQSLETQSPGIIVGEDAAEEPVVGRFTAPGIDQGAPSAVWKDDGLGK